MLDKKIIRKPDNFFEISRLKDGRSLYEIAGLINVSEDALLRYECNFGKTPVAIVVQLYRAYGLSIDEI